MTAANFGGVGAKGDRQCSAGGVGVGVDGDDRMSEPKPEPARVWEEGGEERRGETGRSTRSGRDQEVDKSASQERSGSCSGSLQAISFWVSWVVLVDFVGSFLPPNMVTNVVCVLSAGRCSKLQEHLVPRGFRIKNGND
jgi:hypothetical protein